MSLSKRETIELRFNRVVVFFYCLLIMSVPISIALVESMAGLVINIFLTKKILICVEDCRGRNFKDRCRAIWAIFYSRDHFLNRPVGLYILAVFISVIFSQYPGISLIAFIAKLLEGYALYVSFVDCVKTKQDLRNVVSAYVLTVAVMALDGVSQYIFKSDFLRQLPLVDHRVSATLRHANDFGAYIIVFIPSVFGLLTQPFRKGVSFKEQWDRFELGGDAFSKIVLFVTLVLMLVCLGLTFSRGSWVGFWLSMAFLVVILRKHFFSVVLISAVFIAVFLPLLAKYRDVSFTTDSVNLIQTYGKIDQSPDNLSKLSELEQHRVELAHSFQLGMGRFGFWEEAVGLIRKYPFFGSGLNTYSKLTTGYAHNCYLQMAGEIGLIGLFTFLGLLFALFKQSFKTCGRLTDPFLKVVLVGALSGFAGFMIQSFLDTTLYSVQLGNLMWIVMGLIAVIPRLDDPRGV